MYGINDLIEKIGNRQRRLSMQASTGFPLPSPGEDREGRTDFLDTLKRNNHLGPSPLLEHAERKVRLFEDNVRRIRDSDLTGVEKNRAIADETMNLIGAIEDLKSRSVNDAVKKIDTLESAWKARLPHPEKELLDIKKAELRHHHTTPEHAETLIRKSWEHGYSEAEILVLGATSPETRKLADELLNDVPPFLANQNGIDLLKQASATVDLPAGTVEYTVKKSGDLGETVTQQINVLQLVRDRSTRQTIQDLKLAPLRDNPEGATA